MWGFRVSDQFPFKGCSKPEGLLPVTSWILTSTEICTGGLVGCGGGDVDQ
jgi:hypothetical protein